MHLHRHLFRYRERSILIMRVLVRIDHSRLHKVVSFAMRLRIEPLVTELDISLSYLPTCSICRTKESDLNTELLQPRKYETHCDQSVNVLTQNVLVDCSI